MSNDTIGSVLRLGDLEDLPVDLALACVVGFHMRATLAVTNARHRLRAWALGSVR